MQSLAPSARAPRADTVTIPPGLVLPAFALGFNALLWLARASLSPLAAARAGSLGGWAVATLGPLALLALLARMRLARPGALLLVASLSLGLAGLLSSH